MEVILYERSWIYVVAIHSGLLCEELEMPGGVFALVEWSEPVVAKCG